MNTDSDSLIKRAMSELGKRKKTMTPEAIKQRVDAAKASAKARRKKNFKQD